MPPDTFALLTNVADSSGSAYNLYFIFCKVKRSKQNIRINPVSLKLYSNEYHNPKQLICTVMAVRPENKELKGLLSLVDAY